MSSLAAAILPLSLLAASIRGVDAEESWLGDAAGADGEGGAGDDGPSSPSRCRMGRGGCLGGVPCGSYVAEGWDSVCEWGCAIRMGL